MTPSPLIFLIAGEPSGDLLGGRLMKALKQKCPGIRFAGIGGETMVAEGLQPLFPMSDLSVMGLAEVLAHLPRLMRRIKQTTAAILSLAPDAVVTIDAPDFCFRIARRVRRRNPGIKLIHYVAPSVWAWRPGRARKVAAFLDHLLALLPFEPPYFEREGLACTFVGHPLTEERAGGDAICFRTRHGLNDTVQIVCLLPGSRTGEISRLLPLFLDSARSLATGRSDLFFAIPTVPHLMEKMREALAKFELPHAIVASSEKADAFAAGRVALAASGTVALELGLAGVPAVICYRVSGSSAFLARRLIKVRFVSLVNLILDQEIMPEFLQERATVENVLPALSDLLSDSLARSLQIQAGREANRILKPGGQSASSRGAEIVLQTINSSAAAAASRHDPAG